MGLLIKEKTVVVPGDVIAEGMDYLPSEGTYRSNDKIYAARLGIISLNGKVIKLIPLNGKYLPKRNDLIIGKVIDILISGWRLDTNSPYSAVLNVKEASYGYIAKSEDLSQIYGLDDSVVCTITNVTSQNLVDVTTKGPGLGKLHGGRVIKVNPNKVPRIIGKKGSMISMIKQATGCQIVVGQNGLVWLNGDPDMEQITQKAIMSIEEKAHTSGLTAEIKKFLEKTTGKEVKEVEVSDEPEQPVREHTSREHRPRPPQRRGPPRQGYQRRKTFRRRE